MKAKCHYEFFIGTSSGMGNGNDQMALEFEEIKPIGSKAI